MHYDPVFDAVKDAQSEEESEETDSDEMPTVRGMHLFKVVEKEGGFLHVALHHLAPIIVIMVHMSSGIISPLSKKSPPLSNGSAALRHM